MQVRSLSAGLLFFAAAASAQAQQSDSRCGDPSIVGITGNGGDACQKALDIFHYLTPQFGVLVAGGNATLGMSSATGGPGRFAISVRATGMRTSIPNVEQIGVVVGAPQRSNYQVDDQPAGFPTADASLGVFGGMPLGITRVLSVDALASLTYVPSLSDRGINMSLENSFEFGYGARIGLIQESIVIPGVSVTWLRRNLPKATLAASIDDDTVTVDGFQVKTTAWRIVAGKSLGMMGLALGYGRDTYDAGANLSYVVNDGIIRNTPPNGPFRLGHSPKATNMFADLSFNLIAVKIVAEIGRVTTDDAVTYNSFSKKASDPRLYGALGIRFGR